MSQTAKQTVSPRLSQKENPELWLFALSVLHFGVS